MLKKSDRHARLPKICLVLVLFVFVVGIFSYIRPLPTLDPLKTVQPVITSSTPLNWPNAGESAVGAVGYGILATQNEQTALPTASVAKLITSLAVLQKYPLKAGGQGPTITLTAADVAIYQQYVAEDGSVVQVQAGEQLTEYQALQAMLLPSANNIADSLAIWAFGSLTNYQTYANQFVATLGLTNTHIGSDASGFLPDTTSTAHDLVQIGIHALQNPVLAQIVAQTQTDLPVAGTVYNVNSLLGTDGIFGIKTGNSDQAGGVYLFAAQDSLDASHTITIVGVVQGLADLQTALNAAVPLLDSVKQNFSLATIIHAGQTVGRYTTPWKTTAMAIAKNNLIAIEWDAKPTQPTLTLTRLKTPKANAAMVGTVSLNSGSVTVSTPVILHNSLPNPSFLWRLTRHNF